MKQNMGDLSARCLSTCDQRGTFLRAGPWESRNALFYSKQPELLVPQRFDRIQRRSFVRGVVAKEYSGRR